MIWVNVVFHLLIKMLTPIDMKNTDHCAVKNDVTLIPEHYLTLTMLSSLAWFLLLSVLPASRRCFNLDSGSIKTLQGESGDCFRYNISDIHGTIVQCRRWRRWLNVRLVDGSSQWQPLRWGSHGQWKRSVQLSGFKNLACYNQPTRPLWPLCQLPNIPILHLLIVG